MFILKLPAAEQRGIQACSKSCLMLLFSCFVLCCGRQRMPAHLIIAFRELTFRQIHHLGGPEGIEGEDNLLQRGLVFVEADEPAFFICQ